MATADTLTVRCPSCGHTFSNVSQELWGKKARCGCGHRFVLPSPPVRMSKRALYGAAALGLGLLVVVGIALALFYPSTLPGVQSKETAHPAAQPPAFDAKSVEKTVQWIHTEIHTPVHQAATSRNPWELDRARSEGGKKFSAVQEKRLSVTWWFQVREVGRDSVDLKTMFQDKLRRPGDPTAFVTIILHEGNSLTNDALRIGTQIPLEKAMRLTHGQMIRVSGTIAEIRFRDQLGVCYTDIHLENAKAVD